MHVIQTHGPTYKQTLVDKSVHCGGVTPDPKYHISFFLGEFLDWTIRFISFENCNCTKMTTLKVLRCIARLHLIRLFILVTQSAHTDISVQAHLSTF